MDSILTVYIDSKGRSAVADAEDAGAPGLDRVDGWQVAGPKVFSNASE
jgi:hypothetical protein